MDAEKIGKEKGEIDDFKTRICSISLFVEAHCSFLILHSLFYIQHSLLFKL